MHISGVCLFSYNFKENVEIIKRDLFSAFITAISTFSAELNEELGYSKEYGRLHSIPINQTFEIMISYNGPLIGTLIIEKRYIDEDLKIFLNDVLNEFLLKYKDNLHDWDSDVLVFEPFKSKIERIYKKLEILSFQIPKIDERYEERIVLNENYLSLIQHIDGEKNINEISEQFGKNIDEIKSMISDLMWQEVINLSDKVYDDDIFEPKKDLFYLIKTKHIDSEKNKLTIPEKKLIEFNLLETIDGFKTVFDLSEEFKNLTINEIKHIISFYLSEGSYLEKIELYPQIIAISDKVRKKLKSKDLALAYSLENICDGELSLVEICKQIGIPIRDLKKILDTIGKHVIYRKKYVK